MGNKSVFKDDIKTIDVNEVFGITEAQRTDYSEYFSNLRTAKKLGLPAPHKAVLLLSVMELVEAGVIAGNRIELSERLETTFLKPWKRYVGTSVVFQAKVATPFWHLQNEPFWNLYLNNGKDLSTVTSPYSVSRLRENTHAIIDQELFDLMRDEDSRARLRVLLILANTCRISTHHWKSHSQF